MAEVLQGGKVLARRLKALQRNAQRTILSQAAAAGAEVIREEAVRLAPRSPTSGKHAAEFIKQRRVKGSATRHIREIGYDKKKAWWLLFQELGTKFHAAQPHLRPAMDNKKGEVVAAIGRVFKLGIDAARRAR